MVLVPYRVSWGHHLIVDGKYDDADLVPRMHNYMVPRMKLIATRTINRLSRWPDTRIYFDQEF